MIRRILSIIAAAAIFVAISGSAMAGTVLTDSFTGAAFTSLQSHTADTGQTYTARVGSLKLDGNGGCYNDNNGTSGQTVYTASGSVGGSLTISATVKALSDLPAQIVGLGVADSGGNIYYISSLCTAFNGGGWSLEKLANGSSSSVGLAKLSNTPLTNNVSYTVSLTYVSNGSTATLTVLVQNGSTTVWSTSVTDSSYPACNTYGYRCYNTSTFAGTTTGHHLYAVTGSNAPGITASPLTVVAGTTSTITISGAGTSWTPGTPGTPAFTVSTGTITSQTISSATSATITYVAPNQTGGVTITDPSSSATASISFIGSPQYFNSSTINLSPFNWWLIGTSANTNACGAYFQVGFTGTSCVLTLNTTALGANESDVVYQVDNGPLTTLNVVGRSSITLASGLASGNHTVWFGWQGRYTALDSWNANPPSNSLILNYLTLDPLATLVAITTRPNTLYVMGDSRVEGYHLFSTTSGSGQGATQAAPFALASALNAELGVVAYTGQGYTQGGAQGVPPLYTPGNDGQSSWNKYCTGNSRLTAGLFSPQPTYIAIVNMGGNDYSHGASQASVQASVTGLLASVRAAAPNATILVIPSYEGYDQAYVQAGFLAYQTGSPDGKCIFVDPHFTAAQKSAWSYGAASWLSLDGTHPNQLGNTIVSGNITAAVLSAITPKGVRGSGQLNRSR